MTVPPGDAAGGDAITEIVWLISCGAGPHSGAAVELPVAPGPLFRSAVRSRVSGALGRDLALPFAVGSRRPDPSSARHPEPVPQPAHSSGREGAWARNG